MPAAKRRRPMKRSIYSCEPPGNIPLTSLLQSDDDREVPVATEMESGNKGERGGFPAPLARRNMDRRRLGAAASSPCPICRGERTVQIKTSVVIDPGLR